MGKFSNISLARYKRVLKALGLSYIRTKGGHEMWFKDGMERNIVFQTHINPIPEPIVIKNNKTMGISAEDFEKVLKETK